MKTKVTDKTASFQTDNKWPWI